MCSCPERGFIAFFVLWDIFKAEKWLAFRYVQTQWTDRSGEAGKATSPSVFIILRDLIYQLPGFLLVYGMKDLMRWNKTYIKMQMTKCQKELAKKLLFPLNKYLWCHLDFQTLIVSKALCFWTLGDIERGNQWDIVMDYIWRVREGERHKWWPSASQVLEETLRWVVEWKASPWEGARVGREWSGVLHVSFVEWAAGLRDTQVDMSNRELDAQVWTTRDEPGWRYKVWLCRQERFQPCMWLMELNSLTSQLLEDKPAPETEEEQPEKGKSQDGVRPRTQGRRAFQSQRSWKTRQSHMWLSLWTGA